MTVPTIKFFIFPIVKNCKKSQKFQPFDWPILDGQNFFRIPLLELGNIESGISKIVFSSTQNKHILGSHMIIGRHVSHVTLYDDSVLKDFISKLSKFYHTFDHNWCWINFKSFLICL